MTIRRLDARRATTLRASRLTYPEVGRTAGELPSGYRAFTRTIQLPATADFATVAHDLLHWQVQRRAGLQVAASSAQVTPDAVVILGFGIGFLALHAPCRVVYVVDEPRRHGFAYGTLPGHPESGEEAFLLEQHDGGTITFTVTVFSRPATIMTKLGGPVVRRVQDFVTNRYLRALG